MSHRVMASMINIRGELVVIAHAFRALKGGLLTEGHLTPSLVRNLDLVDNRGSMDEGAPPIISF